MQVFDWSIEDVLTAHPDLYLEHCAAMAVALMSACGPSPCEFRVTCEAFQPAALHGEHSFLARVAWSPATELAGVRVTRTEQRKPLVERAAVALAALAFARLVPGGGLCVTRQGQRADYWLPEIRRALEVSGTEQPRELRRRRSSKERQVLANPFRWNGYVFLCCFHATERLIRWSYHTQEPVHGAN
jgi:hypothetical protein